MKKFDIIESQMVPIVTENIDTDQIIPARFLKSTSKKDFGKNLFRDWRYEKDGKPNSKFILNNKKYKGQILVAGNNFGCGSSREHAAWALKDYGFDVIISSFFADIFKGNALNNGILPIEVEPEILKKIFDVIRNEFKTTAIVNLHDQLFEIKDHNILVKFKIDNYSKQCLMNGYDDIDFLLSQRHKIISFEKKKKW